MKTTKPSKRLDLQGIRGLAIIVVLGFHFYPNIFPNGYLGVDQFFVLSGFLMCMLLKRGGGGGDNMQSCSLITLFYSKRFKRILPLYLLIILLSLLSLYTIFPDTAIETNTKSAEQALLFMSNRPKSVQENYFELLAIGMDIFTHTWSLSVEIQFYFIVPFLFIIGSLFPIYAQYLYYSLIGISSFLFYSISDDNTAFNSVFARIWQFTIGMIVYMVSQTDYSNNGYKLVTNGTDECCEKLMEDGMDIKVEIPPLPTKRSFIFGLTFKYFSLLSLVYITTYPIALPVVIVRPYVTILTGLLMLIPMDDYLLSNRILTYIGDISYSLYLIHWPIYAYWKLTMSGNPMLLVVCLLSSVLFAVICFETFEKWYLKISSTSIGVLVVVLVISNVVLINKDTLRESMEINYSNHSRLDEVTENMTLDDAAKMNYKWNVNDNKNLYVDTCQYEKDGGPLGWCNHTGLNPRGKYKLMIIGNSWTANHGKMFYQECGYKANTLLQGSAYGCEAIYPSDRSQMCKNWFVDFAIRMQNYQPDYVFLLARYFTSGEPIQGTDPHLADDETYQIMKKQMQNFTSNIKKKFYLLEPIPTVNRNEVGNIVPLIKNGTKLVDIDKRLVSFFNVDDARTRYEQLMKDCGDKCIRISYRKDYYNEETQTWRFFDDKGFCFYTVVNHFSPHGMEHVRHIYKDICSQL